jgi:hypothetical protein
LVSQITQENPTTIPQGAGGASSIGFHGELTPPVQLEQSVSLNVWQQILSAVGSGTTFHDHVSTFQGSQPVNITDELKRILDHFGTDGLTAMFAIWNGIVEGVWLDPFHNYIATVLSKARGDGFVIINSIGKSASMPGSRDCVDRGNCWQ